MTSLAVLLMWYWDCPPHSRQHAAIRRSLHRADAWRWDVKLIPSYDD